MDLEQERFPYNHPQGSAPEEKDLKQEEWEPNVQDAFGNEETAEVKYKVLKWWYVLHRASWHDMIPAMILTPTGNVVYVCIPVTKSS